MDFALRPAIASSAEPWLRSLLGSVEFGILFTGLDHTALACSRRFGDIFGIGDISEVVSSDAYAVRKMVQHRIPDLQEWEANLEDVYADPTRIQHDTLTLVHPRALIERTTGPVMNQAGEIVGRIWTFRDITQESHLRGMRDVLHESTLLFDSDPSVVYQALTEAVGDFYGSLALLSIRVGDFMQFRAVGGPPSPARDLAGNPLADSYCQFCLQASQPLIIQDAAASEPHKDVLPARFGLTRYAGVPIRSPEGEAIGTLCIMDDRSSEPLHEEDLRFLSLIATRIAGELERERQLQNLRQDLEQTQAQLLQSEKLAVIGTLSASISHDIRNILSAIALELSMGKHKPEETLAGIEGHLDRFHLLSHKLLAYAKPNELVFEWVRVPDVVERSLGLLSGHLRANEISLEYLVTPHDCLVKADPSRLGHLFVNLILNAIQSMSNGGKVTVAAVQKGAEVSVTITDTGKGIPSDQMDRLFLPFQSSRADGFGLGLYSCQQIAREIGGRIEVESRLGAGTSFRVVLPCQIANES